MLILSIFDMPKINILIVAIDQNIYDGKLDSFTDLINNKKQYLYMMFY